MVGPRCSRALGSLVLGAFLIGSARVGAATTTILVPGGALHGVNGLAIGPDGALYAASFVGGTISKIDKQSGRVEILVSPPQGDADDVAVRGDEVIAWTGPLGELGGKWPGEPPKVIADQLPSINPIAWASDGRIAVGQIGDPDAVWLIDPQNPAARRKVIGNAGHLNGFAFGSDGRLYGPMWQHDSIVAIDMQRGTETVVAHDVGMPAAVKVDPRGQLVSVDWLRGDVRRTDPKTGQSQILATATPPLDNLALGPDGTIYISNPADSTIQALAPNAHTFRDVVRGRFSAAAGMTMVKIGGQEMLLVADPLAYRLVDPRNGEVTRPPWVQDVAMSTDVVANDNFIVTSHQSRGLILKIARQEGGVTGSIVEEHKLKSATGVALMANGDIVAADFDDGQLVRLGKDTNQIVATGLGGPMNILILSDTRVLVSEALAGVVSEIDLRSGQRRVVARGLSLPEGLARLPRGRIAVAEKGKGRVVAVKLTGALNRPEVLAEGLPVATFAFRALPDVGLPMGLAADADGTLFVTCGGDNSIRKIASKS